MTTIYEVCPIGETNRFESFFASTMDKAVSHLASLGFKDVTAPGADEYTEAKVYAKNFEGNAFVQGEIVIVVVKPFDRFIA